MRSLPIFPISTLGSARLASILSTFLILSACATPADVKTLSTAQIGYFDAAIAAVRVQSEALLAAAETIKQQAETQIDAEVQKVRDNIPMAIASTIPTTPEAQRVDAARRLIDAALPAAQAAAASKARLQATLDQIRSKTQELQTVLEQMKQVQIALDAYLQSEQVGESVTASILGYPGVQNLIVKTNAVMTNVSARANELSQLLTQLKG